MDLVFGLTFMRLCLSFCWMFFVGLAMLRRKDTYSLVMLGCLFLIGAVLFFANLEYLAYVFLTELR